MSVLKRHSPVAHSAYLDLLRSLSDKAASDLRGMPTRGERNGRVYWYDSYRVGSDVKKSYIGEDSSELRDRIARAADMSEEREERRRHRARLIRILRAEGFLGVEAATGSLLGAMAAAGVFRLGSTIVGTPVALEDTVSEPLQKVLGDFSFAPMPALDDLKTWRWKQTRNDLLVGFLTPSFAEAEDLRPLAALGAYAQSLHYLNYLIADPITAAIPYRNGVLVQIPRPERLAIHKLIIADRRRDGPDSLKTHKDRMQASFLIEILAEDRPDDLREAYEDAMTTGPHWRDRINATLKRLRSVRDLLEK